MISIRPLVFRISVIMVFTIFLLSGVLACSSQQSTSTQTSSTPGQPATTQASGKTIELKIAHMETTTHFLHALAQNYAQQIEEKTNGKVHFTIYPSGTLCDPPALYDSVKGGVADIGIGTCGYNPAQFELNSFCTDNMHYAISSKIGTQIYSELYNNNTDLQAEFNGTKILWLAVHSPGNLHVTFPVTKLDDLKGKEIRYPGSLSVVAKALGMVPVSMSMADTFMSIQKGIVQGCTAPTSELEGHRFAEVTEYTLNLKYYVGARYTIMNTKTWDSLPEDVKAVFNSMTEWGTANECQGWDNADAKAMEFAKQYQHQYIDLTPDMKTSVAKIFDDTDKTQAAALDAKGKPGTAILTQLNQIEAKYNTESK